MKNKYPAYRVFAAGTKEMFRYFPKSTEGLEQAIEYAKNNHCYYVFCVKGPGEEPELVWGLELAKQAGLELRKGVNYLVDNEKGY